MHIRGNSTEIGMRLQQADGSMVPRHRQVFEPADAADISNVR